MDSIKTVTQWGNIRYKNEIGEFHRTDGPAIEYTNGHKEWWINGLLHREDGPAIVFVFSDGVEQYWLNGKRYPKEEYEHLITKIKLNRLKNL